MQIIFTTLLMLAICPTLLLGLATKDTDMKSMFDAAQDYFFTSISEDILRIGQNCAYYTGMEEPHLNPAVVKDTSVILAFEEFYTGKSSPWVVIAENFNHPGFHLHDRSKAMGIHLKEKFDMPGDKTIKFMNDHLQEWATPLTQAFGGTPESSAKYAKIHQKAHNFYHFSSYEDGLPIASITISIQGQIARIDDVGTIPAYARRGHATALMKHALNFAHDSGVTHCFLGASNEGAPVYERLGFEILFEITEFGEN